MQRSISMRRKKTVLAHLVLHVQAELNCAGDVGEGHMEGITCIMAPKIWHCNKLFNKYNEPELPAQLQPAP